MVIDRKKRGGGAAVSSASYSCIMLSSSNGFFINQNLKITTNQIQNKHPDIKSVKSVCR